MELTIKAVFKEKESFLQATGALQEQGVIGIHYDSGQENREIFAASPYFVDVFVEPSRSRQAEDTIIKFGGQFARETELQPEHSSAPSL